MNEIERAAAEEFDAWASRGHDEAMASGHGRFTEIALADWDLGPDSHVLDVGCGNGWAVRRVLTLGAGAATGIDISPKMIAQARPPGTYLQGPGDRLPFDDGTFTHLISIESLYYYPDPDRALVEWARVVAPGGELCLLIDLYTESPIAPIWQDLLPVKVHVRSEATWADEVRQAGWSRVTRDRILDPKPPQTRDEFEPDEWAPTYEEYLASKAAGTLRIRARR